MLIRLYFISIHVIICNALLYDEVIIIIMYRVINHNYFI